VAWPVEARRAELLGDGHPHCIGEALAQWTSGDFHTRGEPTLWMPGAARTPFTETLQLIEGKIKTG
jgi:hypothetical protein